MITRRIEGYLDEASLDTLMIKKRDFSWTDLTTGSIKLDGPTMLQIIIQGISPTTRDGVSDFKKSIQNFKLSMFDNSVKDILDDMYANYQEIIVHSHTHTTTTPCIYLMTFLPQRMKCFVSWSNARKIIGNLADILIPMR